MFSLSAWGAELPVKPSKYFSDNTGVVTASQALVLNEKLATFHKETGVQFVIANFQSLNGENLEDYSNRIFNKWGIGDKQNHGLAFFNFAKERKVRFEVGIGNEGWMPDSLTKRIFTDSMRDHFKSGNYYLGYTAGIDAVRKHLKEPISKEIKKSEMPLIAIIMLIIFIGAIIYIFYLFIKYSFWRCGGSSSSSSWYSGSTSWGSGSSGSSCSFGGGSSGGGGSSSDY